MRGVLLIACLGCMAACQLVPHAQKGGGATVAATAPSLTASTTPRPDGLPAATITQPENPQGSSGQDVSFERETVTTVPTEAHVVTATARPDGSTVTVTETFPAGTQRRESVKQAVKQNLGGSWKDTARELGVRLAAMRPAMWLGVALIPLGVAAWWLVSRAGWSINASVVGGGISGSGVAVLCLSAWLPTVNPLLGLLLLIGCLGAAALVYAAYYKAHHDAHLPPTS